MIFRPVLDKVFRFREHSAKTAAAGSEDADPYEKPFLDHLEDLRMMFMRVIITQVVVTIFAFIFHEQLFDFMFHPVRSERSMIEITEIAESGEEVINRVSLEDKINLVILSPAEAFMLSIKVAFIAGFILAFPLHSYFLGQFILPGLTETEKKYILPGIGIGFLLFLFGASFAFFGALPYALKFLFSYGLSLDIASTWRIGYYIGFVSQVTLIFGVCFQMPLVVTILVRLRLLTYRAMKGSRSLAIIVLCVLSAVFTPPDPVTMIFMAVPMIILYEICIWIAYFMNRKQDAIDAQEEAEYQEWLATQQKEEARLAESRQLATTTSTDSTGGAGADDRAALHDEWDDDHYHSDNDPYHDWKAGSDDDNENWIDHYSEDLHEVDCPEDRANIARRRKKRALIEAAKAQAENLVNINYASVDELTSLPGIGNATAEKIVAGRPYKSNDDLLEIEGLTQAKLDAIESRIFAG